MLFFAVASLLIALSPAPGDGLGLAPGDPAPRPSPPPLRFPVAPVDVPLAVGATALAVRASRRRSAASASSSPIFVFVPGHGGGPEDFADLIDRMGLDAGSVAFFDYRWAYPIADDNEAARWATASDSADVLHAFVRGLAEDHDSIYLVGHSKGGAVITELLSRWDELPALGVPEVSGAALLDPAISAGPLGGLQRIGWLVGDVPDNGWFDPVRCGWWSCIDVRAHLGERAGVEVVAIRNPDALLPNFTDEPEGLRVFDLDDGGPDPLGTPWDLPAVLKRMGEAHGSVLHSDQVADCIIAEAHSPGSCEWPVPATYRSRYWGRGRPAAGPLMK